MVIQINSITNKDIIYPESDGKPMADNTLQFRWITTIKTNLDWLFAQDETVFIAGDLLWYPEEGNNKKSQAPDVMVIFGRPKGERRSYQQWKEENIAPQVVFEILSPSNTPTEMSRKLLFYQSYGVEEYYIYDTNKNELSGLIQGENGLKTIEEMNGWVSPRLQIRFEVANPELKLYHPNGEVFTSYTEEKQRADQANQRADQESQRAEKLAKKLRELNINPDDL
ncbi:MAG: Uma2 family endonuclease [Microcystaceae cyanobacterium]